MEGHADQENTPLPSSSQDVPPSSPLAPSNGSQKPSKPPTVTPKRFNKFFSPRGASSSGRTVTASGRELRDITRSAANNALSARGLGDLADTRPSKRRKTSLASPEADLNDFDIDSSPPEPEEDDAEEPPVAKPVRIIRAKQQHVYPDRQSYTADFWSGPDLVYNFNSRRRPRFMPFSMAACNTNSLVAIGGEHGYVRLLDAADGPSKFSDSFMTFKTLNNAILEMCFSSDDSMLGLAGGDQTARIVDMQTQQQKAVLKGHTSSLKQVAFQPGNDNIVSTCARDGTIQVWDIRAPGNDSAVELRSYDFSRLPDPKPKCLDPLNRIIWGCREPGSLPGTPTSRSSSPSMTCLSFLSAARPHLLVSATDTKAEIRLWDIRHRQRTRDSPDGSAPISRSAPIASHVKNRHFGIASLALSADSTRLYSLCRNATVYTYSTSHLVLGSASTVLSNNAPNPTPSFTRRAQNPSWSQGAGPLYGLRSPNLHAATFYMRCAIRQPVGNKPELLGVSSGDPTPVLFPTDETLLRKLKPVNAPSADTDIDSAGLTSSIKRGGSSQQTPPSATSLLNRSTGTLTPRRAAGVQNAHGGAGVGDAFPVYETGTALVGGHTRDVTGVAWTSEGELVSISDDWCARLWRERPGVVQTPGGPTHMQRPAAWLRRQPVGREWRYGFAKVDAGFDEDEDEDE